MVGPHPEDRIRYTPSSAFETFPWPDPDETAFEAIGDLGRTLIACRAEICAEAEIGLTDLYNQSDAGAWADLTELHLKPGVRRCWTSYGWADLDPGNTVSINTRLYERNRDIRDGERDYAGPPVGP